MGHGNYPVRAAAILGLRPAIDAGATGARHFTNFVRPTEAGDDAVGRFKRCGHAW